MIVVDTCVLIHFYQESDQTELARKVWAKESTWIYPSLWVDEYANVLSIKARRYALPVQPILKHFQMVQKRLQGNVMPVDKVLALEIAIKEKISAYDAQFVFLARYHGIPLVTEDQEVLKKCADCALSMKHFLEIEE